MIEALVGILAIVVFVLVVAYIEHRRQQKEKHAH